MTDQIDMSNYKLVFSEDFDSLRLLGEPDGFWKTSGYWDERTLSGNGELQYYVDPVNQDLGVDPFSVENGVLTIRAEKASDDIKPQIENLDYTSGMITSERGFTMQYGYFEIRAEMPEGKGLWPAFWLLTADGEWPPELDVVEVLGHEPDKLYGTSHYEDAAGNHVMDHAVSSKGLFDSSDGFHTYGIDWQEDKVVWYYDGIKVGETENHIFDQAVYMIANLAVGGYWPGNPDSSTQFPGEMKIDYIRAYQKAVDHAVVGVPEDWAPIGVEAFTLLTRDGAKTTWSWEYNLSSTDTSAVLSGDWARYLTGNEKANFLVGSSAPYNELLGGGGNDTLQGGKGTDVFIIRDGDGNDTILDLSNSAGNTDKIQLEGFHFTHFDDVKPWLAQVGADVILRLDQDQALLLKNTAIDSISPEMFIFNKSVAAPANAPILSQPAPAPEPEPVPAPPPPPAPSQPTAETGAAVAKINIGTTEAEKLTLSGGYKAEANTAASSGALIKVLETGEAAGSFTGEAGTYKMSVRYLDEFDGTSTFVIKVNGEAVDSWTGTGSSSDIFQVRSFDVALKAGDIITVSGTQGGWEHSRVDWLKLEKVAAPEPEPAPAPLPTPVPTAPQPDSGSTVAQIDIGTTEAEKLTLSGGYKAEAKKEASSGAQIKVVETGEATGSFTGEAGSYKMTIRYLDEFDGAASWTVKVNDQTVTSWTGAGTGTTDQFADHSFNLDLKTGDKISIVGAQGEWEHARVDWLKLEKVAAPQPAPVPTPTGPAIAVGTTEAEKLSLSGGYKAEANSAASSGAQIKVVGSGEATGSFTGEAGKYKMSVGYIDEFDGAASFAVKINGQVVNAWTGTGASGADRAETRSFDVDLKPGDTITFAGTQGNWEHARVDWLKLEKQVVITGPTISTGVTQADTLTLKGYVKEQNSAATDGTLIMVRGSGTAQGTFSGEDGHYNLDVGYLNENDGVAKWNVQVNGQVVGSWAGTGGNGSIETSSFALDLKTGDKITVAGSQDVGEYARIDWLKLTGAPTMAGTEVYPLAQDEYALAHHIQLIGVSPAGSLDLMSV